MPGLDKISPYARTNSFFFEASSGLMPGYTPLIQFGENSNLSTAQESIWNHGGIYVPPTTATQMIVSSSDNNDDSAGTGARMVGVVGVDSDYRWQHEFVPLNGQVGQSTQKEFLRINQSYIVYAGTAGGAAGNIYIGTGTLTAGEPTNVYSKITGPPENDGRSQQTNFTVPTGYRAAILGVLTGTGKAKEVKAGIYVAPWVSSINASGVYQVVGSTFRYESDLFIQFRASPTFDERFEIDMRARAIGTPGVEVIAGYTIMLQKKDLHNSDIDFILPGALIPSKTWTI